MELSCSKWILYLKLKFIALNKLSLKYKNAFDIIKKNHFGGKQQLFVAYGFF